MCCRNISAIVPDMGKPIETHFSGWYVRIFVKSEVALFEDGFHYGTDLFCYVCVVLF
jgi:hypothetical protein